MSTRKIIGFETINGRIVPKYDISGTTRVSPGITTDKSNVYWNISDKNIPTVNIYSAKDETGNPIRDLNGQLITGNTQEEALLKFNNMLRDNTEFRYSRMTPSKGISTITHSDINNNIINPAFLVMGTAYENTIGKVPVVSDIMNFTGDVLSIPQWVGTIGSGKAPWNPENRGFNEYDMFNINDSGNILNNYGNVASMFTGPKTLKRTGKVGHNYIQGVERRGIETAMRTTDSGDPINYLNNLLKHIFNGAYGGKPRLLNIGNYILTGNRKGPKGYYNSLAKFIPDENHSFKHPSGVSFDYGGFTKKGGGPRTLQGNDIIDAFLYGKEIDPKYGLNRIPTDYGVHTDYVKSKYPNKDIKVYELNDAVNQPIVDLLNSFKIEGVVGDLFNKTSPYGVDAAGHLQITGKDLTGNSIFRHQDIWKFNPDDYIPKYINNGMDRPYNKFKTWIIRKGLLKVDDMGNPIIFRTKWKILPTFTTPEIKYTPSFDFDFSNIVKKESK